MVTASISPAQVQLFMLVFVRLASVVAFLPIFNSAALPMLFKAGFGFAAAFAIYPVLGLSLPAQPLSVPALGLALGAEVLLGIMIGFVVRFVLIGFQMAGQLAGYQMGMALADVMDPSTSEQVPLLAQFYNLLALMVLLAIDAHHWFIRAVVDSFKVLPPLGLGLEQSVLRDLGLLAGTMFVIAIKVGAPVVVALLLTSVSFGLVARTVPQMNVFIVAMPLKIMVGILFVGLSLSFLVHYMAGVFEQAVRQVIDLLRAAA